MNEVMTGGTGAYVVKTFIDVIKPLIPESKKGYIPLIAVLMGVLYGMVFFEGGLEVKIAGGVSIGAISIASHESTKLFTTNK